MSEQWLKVVCIKPITLNGEDDCLDDSQHYEIGYRHDHVRILDNGMYEFSYGTAWYYCIVQDFEQYFDFE